MHRPMIPLSSSVNAEFASCSGSPKTPSLKVLPLTDNIIINILAEKIKQNKISVAV